MGTSIKLTVSGVSLDYAKNDMAYDYVTLRSGWEWELPIHNRIFLWEELLEGYNNAPHSIFGGFSRALEWLAEGRIYSMN